MRTLITKHPWAAAGSAALFVLLAVMATWIVRASYVSPEQRLTHSARDLVERAFSADPAAMDELFDITQVGTVQLLTRETAAVAMGPSPTFTVDSTRLTKRRTFELDGTLHTASGPVRVRVTYERSTADDPWVLQKLRPPHVLVSGYPLRGEVSINGVAVGNSAINTVRFATWPGQARVSAEGFERQDVRLLGALSEDSSIQGTTVSLVPSGRLDDAGLENALSRALSSCLGPADLSRVDCIFGPPEPPDGSTSVHNVGYSELRLANRTARSTVGAATATGSQSGSVLVTGQWKTASGWKDFSTRSTFRYDYLASVDAAGTITVTPDPNRGGTPYETNTAWSRALTDRGSTDADD